MVGTMAVGIALALATQPPAAVVTTIPSITRAPEGPVVPPISREDTFDPEYGVITGLIYGRLYGVDGQGRLLVRQVWRQRRTLRVRASDITEMVAGEGGGPPWERFVTVARARSMLAECPGDRVVAAEISVPFADGRGRAIPPGVTLRVVPRDSGWLTDPARPGKVQEAVRGIRGMRAVP